MSKLIITGNKTIDPFINLLSTKFPVNDEKINEIGNSISLEAENVISLIHQALITQKKEIDRSQNGGRPVVGSRVVAMWGQSKWQYFMATIIEFDPQKLMYKIDWDDGDPTGRDVHYKNLALDFRPDSDSIATGSSVLFQQGSYTGQTNVEGTGVDRSAGLRWHQGIITEVTTNATTGVKYFNGHHSKTEKDGKWCTFKGYSYEFRNLTLDDLRLPPNVFDVMTPNTNSTNSNSKNSAKVNDDLQNIDIYLSHANDFSKKVEQISENLKSNSYKLFVSKPGRGMANELQRSLTALTNAKIFIACISDDYASNEKTLQELQYAKKSLGIFERLEII